MPVVRIDTVNTGYGILFGASGQEYDVNPGVLVASTGKEGVLSILDSDSLFNFGEIFSTSTDAVVFSGNNGQIINESGGIISGANVGVVANGHTETIDNFGSIFGLSGDGVFFGANSTNVQLTIF